MEIIVQLTPTQITILKNLEQGLTQKEISKKMVIPTERIKVNIYTMCCQFNCRNSTQLIGYAIRNKII